MPRPQSLVLLLVCSCSSPTTPASTPSTASASSAHTSQAGAPAEPPKRQDGGQAGDCLELASVEIKACAQATGFLLRGERAGQGFQPSSDVEGEGALAQENVDGPPGYLELQPLSFMSATEARAPQKPYVKGVLTPNGFVPSSRRVVR